VIRANELCNIYGLDTISTGSVIQWLMECHQRELDFDRDGLDLGAELEAAGVDRSAVRATEDRSEVVEHPHDLRVAVVDVQHRGAVEHLEAVDVAVGLRDHLPDVNRDAELRGLPHCGCR